MRAFSRLLERLYYEPSTLGKERLLLDYFAATPDPDRGLAVAVRALEAALRENPVAI